MADLSYDLIPQYGLHPRTNEPYWPSEATGYPTYDTQVREWMDNAYEEAQWEYSQNDESSKVDKYIEYIVGKQWPRERATYKSSPVNNRIWRLFWEIVSLLTDIRPFIDIKANEDNYKHQAEMLNKTIKSWWLGSDADLGLALTVIYGLLSTGYTKLTWNSELRGREGDFEIIPVGPSDVLPLKARTKLDEAEAIIYKSVQSLGWFRRKFPQRGYLVKHDPNYSRYAVGESRPKHVPAMLWDMLAPQMRRVLGGQQQYQSSVYPMALYRETWFNDFSKNTSNAEVLMGEPGTNWCYKVKPGGDLYPRGRLVIMGGSIILHDGPNPYWHGKFPFSALRLNVVPWQFLGLSEFRSLVPLQDIVNNTIAGIMDAIKKIVNPIFYAPKNAFSDSVWESLDWGMPGAKAAYNQMVSHQPQFGPAPALPAGVFQFLQWICREMDQSSGIAAVTEALKKKQVPAGDTLENIKETQSTPLRLKGRNMEVFLRDLGTMSIFNIFQFYTLKRRMYIAGEAGKTPEDFDWDPGTAVPAGENPEDHARRFAFMVQPGSLLNINRVEKIAAMARLRAVHDIDRRTLLENLDMGLNPDVIEKRLLEEIAKFGPPKIDKKAAARAAKI
jgi:hypothetical protein